MDLHETPSPMAPAMALALEANFGSVQRWRDGFVAMARGAGAAGRVLLCFQPDEGTLSNQALADPAQPVRGVALLALEAGGRTGGAAASVDAFVQHIDWARVYERYQEAVARASEGLGATVDEAARARLLDVRRAGVFELAASIAAGAQWCDPARVARWAAELPKDEPVVVYCVHGHEVGRATAMRLRAAGVDARFLIGGFDAWQAAGRPLADRPPR